MRKVDIMTFINFKIEVNIINSAYKAKLSFSIQKADISTQKMTISLQKLLT